MDYAEFHELTESTIRGMYDRIPAKYHEAFEMTLEVGETRIAFEDLLGGLARLNIPITPTERGRLSRLLAYLEEPEDKLDALNVTATSGS